MAYQQWTFSSGIKRTVTKKNFGNRLGNLGYPTGRGTGGVRQRVGIMLKQGVNPGSTMQLVDS